MRILHGVIEELIQLIYNESRGLRMGVCLFDRKTNEIIFDVNFWNYRAIVEAIRSLGVLPASKVDSLHELWRGNGLSTEEAHVVANAIRHQLLTTLVEGERLLFDGSRTPTPDDGTLYKEPAQQQRNYSTKAEVLEQFARCCETCNGFNVC